MNTLFVVSLVVALLFGLGFTLAPATLLSLYDVTLSENGVMVAQLFGSEVLAFAVLLWYVRRSENAEFRRGAVRAMFTYWVLGTVFLIIGQLAGLMNVMGWGTIALHAALVVWYGLYAFKST
jgi:hypothetical protein